MKYPYIILTALFVLFVWSCKQAITGEVKVISPEEMHTFLQIDDVQFIDVRTLQEHNKEFIPKSQNIDFRSPTFLEDIDKLDKNKPVLLYCRTGRRSAKCAQELLDAGFVKIYDLEGGISKWKHDGFEVDTKL
ncbi:thioredoxin [Pseudalgibacter alginicilyticus]|uniref:Thioredoxin n=1 Tax=Pseudalgibacter alginicilyticus TaxID=1736674 RepID=A0A0P0CJH4_9FLAO|nr:rhodanese-like domain-containing protein [Pseudalgibacter alginicilyticus]ALJ06361.1 thioredoxin [Pseudalgibacter alginicilyticus]